MQATIAVRRGASKGQFRSRIPPLWLFFVAATVAHALLIVGTSPSIYLGNGGDDSPQALFARAEQLEEEGKFEDAFNTYSQVVSKKPLIPAVFIDAEKKMNETRLKSIQAQKKTEDEKAAAAKAAANGKPGDQKTAGAGGKRPGKTADGGQAPPVALPELPDIGQ